MTLSMTMGIAIGVRNTMKMMVGELIGVLIVAGISVVGGGTIISSFPTPATLNFVIKET